LNLKKSLKIASVVSVLLLALGVVAFVYANSQIGAGKNNEQSIGISEDFWSTDQLPKHLKPLQPKQNSGLEWLRKFIAQSNATRVDGTVVSEFNGMLILSTEEGQERVLLPKFWSLDNEVIGRGKLFSSTFSGIGQVVTVKVLKSVLFEKDSFSINVMIGYEIINTTDTHTYAVLPFNIGPSG
jgi:hypothetical protein